MHVGPRTTSHPRSTMKEGEQPMGAMSPWHWAILAVVMVLLFGAKRLPDSARALGKSMRIFRAEVSELHADEKTAGDGTDRQSIP